MTHTHDERPIIRMDQMEEGKRYHSTVVSGEYFKAGGRYFYTNGATGTHKEVALPPEEKRTAWAFMVFEERKQVSA